MSTPAICIVAEPRGCLVRIRTDTDTNIRKIREESDISTFAPILAQAGIAMSTGQRPKNGTAPRILIVDDNCDAANTTVMWLNIRGYKAEAITDSTECLSHLESFKPDVLLLDIAMPQVSGYELARTIRANPRFESLAAR